MFLMMYCNCDTAKYGTPQTAVKLPSQIVPLHSSLVEEINSTHSHQARLMPPLDRSFSPEKSFFLKSPHRTKLTEKTSHGEPLGIPCMGNAQCG